MSTVFGPIPWDGYWRSAGQVFSYWHMSVFAPDQASADRIAGGARFDGYANFCAAMDSAEASGRLGLWGRPDLLKTVLRGD